LIAGGLSPLRPELAALAAGRLFLSELDRLAKGKNVFAFESTLSGLTYMNRLTRWKRTGYRIEIYLSAPVIATIWLYDVSPRELNKADITCREPMCSGVLRAA
jgi:predicted ABC-type ATPase